MVSRGREERLIAMNSVARKHARKAEKILTCGLTIANRFGRYIRFKWNFDLPFDALIAWRRPSRFISSRRPWPNQTLDSGSIISAFSETASRSNLNRALLRASQKGKENEETPYSHSVASLSAYCCIQRSDRSELNFLTSEICDGEKTWASVSCDEGPDKPGASSIEVAWFL